MFLSFFFCLCRVFVAACGLSLVAASGGYSSLRCVDFSLQQLLLLRSTGSRRTWASVVAARGLSSCGTRALEGTGFSSCSAWALGHAGFSSCGAQALERRLSSCGARA